MKFTYNWLKQYVDFDWSPEELAEKLTMAGIEVESAVTFGGGVLEQVVVCEVLSSEKHPNADKLSVCKVNDGKAEHQIVCGAKNYKVGDKVPLALPGLTLPNGMTIKPAKLRGVESNGMMCSAQELLIAEYTDGLLILPQDTTLGISLTEALGGVDTVYDIEVTPNRPDWLGVIGIAREISALTGNPLRLPDVTLNESETPVEDTTTVTLDAPDLCPRYTARVIQGVKPGPSPAWLKQLLQKIGMRSISNIVDITNFVLLECGQPLHAFDFNLLADRKISVRRALKGEKFTAIDESEHELSEDMLVIADASRPVALAGIMGGKDSEITDQTTDVILESACFVPDNVRKTSKQSTLSSESSYRFERGTDIEGVLWASSRATSLIHQLAGGKIARGVVDVLHEPIIQRHVTCRFAQVNRVIGVEVPKEKVIQIFNGLGLHQVNSGSTDLDSADKVEVAIPTFRVDLAREADLIEEVCRMYGVNKIPSTMKPAVVAVSDFDTEWDTRARVRQILCGLGYFEAQNQTMVRNGDVPLLNPLTSEQGTLRSSLVPGLLGNVQTNVSRHQLDVRLFEMGHVFNIDGSESYHLAFAATGHREPGSWDLTVRDSQLDIFNLKGAIEELATSIGVSTLTVKSEDHLPESVVLVNGKSIGKLWQVPLTVAKKMDFRSPVFVAEIRLQELLCARETQTTYQELPKFPAVVRDVALIVDESVQHARILEVIKNAQTKNLEEIQLFDVFQGGSIPRGKKSMAYSFRFRSHDKTLTDTEINQAHDKIKRKLEQELHCEIRV